MPALSKQERSFLKALDSGLSINEAAKKGGFTRVHYYRLKRKNPKFSEKWDEILSNNTMNWIQFLNIQTVGKKYHKIHIKPLQGLIVVNG